MEVKLSKRLLQAADFQRKTDLLADIGADHGLLCSYLILNGIAKKAVCTDINKGPLNNAKKTAKKYKIEDKMDFILSDGCEKVLPLNDVIICGMGGLEIINIISKTPWLKNKDISLILQPQSKLPELREYMYKNGFYMKNEKSVFENEFCYNVMLFGFSDKYDYEEEEIYLSKPMAKRFDEEDKRYLDILIKETENCMDKINTATENATKTKEIYEKKRMLLLRIREKYADKRDI